MYFLGSHNRPFLVGESMKAYLLARVSTDEQKDALPAQTIRLKEYAAKHNYECELFEIQESAFKGDRQYFRQVVDKIDLDKQKTIVVFDKIDRLTRDPTSLEYIRLVRLYESGRIELHFPSDNVFLHKDSPAHDKMRLGFGVTLAQYYSASSSDNVKRRFAQMWQDGVWTGAAPFGYRYIVTPEGKKWIEPHPAEAEIVRYTFKTYATGTSSLHVLAEEWRSKFGLQVRHCRIERVLKNPFYYGDMRVKGVLYPHKYEPLVTRDVFDKVHSVLTGYQAKPHRWAGLPFSYRNLIVCAECGCKVTFEIKKKKYVYGHCTQYKYKHEAKYINENKLTEQFEKIIAAVKIPDDELQKVLKLIKQLKEESIHRVEQKRKVLETEIAKYQTRLARMYDDRLDGLISPEIYEQKHADFTKTKENLERDLQNIELLDNKRLDDFSYLLELSNKAPKLLKKANIDEKRKLIKMILSNLELDKELLRWKYKKPFDLMASCAENANWCPLTDTLRNSTD